MMCSLLCAQHCHYCMQMPDVDSGLAPAASAVVHFSTLALCCRAVEMNHDIFFLNLFFCYLLYEYSIPLKQPGWFLHRHWKTQSWKVCKCQMSSEPLRNDYILTVTGGWIWAGLTDAILWVAPSRFFVTVSFSCQLRFRTICGQTTDKGGEAAVGAVCLSALLDLRGLTVPFLCHALKGIRSSK